MLLFSISCAYGLQCSANGKKLSRINNGLHFLMLSELNKTIITMHNVQKLNFGDLLIYPDKKSKIFSFVHKHRCQVIKSEYKHG